MRLPHHIILYFVCIAAACTSTSKKTARAQYKEDSLAVHNYIDLGDSIYSAKANFSSFTYSLELYDSAWQIASRTKDTTLIAASIFAKGRAFDALNNNPQKTIDYYTEAAQLYAHIPLKQYAALYIKQLVAHSYDKVKDSVNCVRVLHELYAEINPKHDSLKKKYRFISEMALISTEVKNYDLADSILKNLTKREWIENNVSEYDYLNHYYITQARIHVLMRQNMNTPYLDSLENVLANCENLSDSIFYASQLHILYEHAKNNRKKYYFLHLNNALENKFKSPDKLREAQEIIVNMEVAGVEMQRDLEKKHALRNQQYNYLLLALLAIISALGLFLHKRNREIKKKKNEVLLTNQELQKKNVQNEILNKEIQHRVKNNLQMIMSLVYMQERQSENPQVKENMQTIRLRIESIAKLHEQLMGNNEMVDLKYMLHNWCPAYLNYWAMIKK